MYVKAAAISDQAYETDLYGPDSEIEEALATLEGRASSILASIKDTGMLPTAGSEERLWLCIFIMFQAERTKAAAGDTEKATDAVLKDVPNITRPSSPKVRLAESSILRLSMLSPSFPLMLDLDMKLLSNDSPNEFVTSDNPVVRYNQFIEYRQWPGSGAGWASPGLQILFPVSPRALLLIYDREMYMVGNDKTPFWSVTSTGDINWINGLQFLIADENIYASPGVSDFYLMRLNRRWAPKRRPRFTVSEYRQQSPNPRSRQSSLIVTSMNDLRVGLDLSFIRFRIDPITRKLGPSMWNPRNAYVEKILEGIYGKPLKDSAE